MSLLWRLHACFCYVLFWPIPYPVVHYELLWIMRNVNKELNWKKLKPSLKIVLLSRALVWRHHRGLKIEVLARDFMFVALLHCIIVLLSLNMRLNNPSRSDVRWCIPVIPQWVLLATKKFRRVVNSIGQCVFCVESGNHCIKIQHFVYLQDNNTQYV
jgi:hypothetical protein